MISGQVNAVVSAATIVCGIRFSQDLLWKKTVVFVYIKWQTPADSQKMCKRRLIHGGGFISVPLLCEPKKFFKCYISLILHTLKISEWRWMISVILRANKIVWEWTANQLDTWRRYWWGTLTVHLCISCKFTPKELIFQGG